MNQIVAWDDIRLFENEGVWVIAPTVQRPWEVVVGDENGSVSDKLLAEAKQICNEAALHSLNAVAYLMGFVERFTAEGWSIDALRFETPNSFTVELSHEKDIYGFWTVLFEATRFNGGDTNYGPTKFSRTQD